jgi:protein O-GlcNAc transferase
MDNLRQKYSKAQELASNGIIDSKLYSECIEESSKIVLDMDKLNIFELQRQKKDVIDAYYINAELLGRSVGLQNPVKPYTENQKNVLYTSVNRLQRVLSLDPFHKSSTELYKIILLLLTIFNSNMEENIVIIEKILSVDPSDYQVQFNLGFSYQRNNNLDKALQHFKLTLGLLKFHKQIEKNQEVLKIIDQFIVKTFNCIGTIYYTVQDRYLANCYLYEALKIFPDDPDVHNQIGVVYTELRLTDKAIEHYQKSIKNYKKTHISTDLDMLLASVHMNMGLAYCYEINYPKAIECYNQALKYKPTLSLAYQNKLLDVHYISHLIEDPMYIYKLHKNINKIYPKVVTSFGDYTVNKDVIVYKNTGKLPSKKLKIGFVSGDFICHPVSYFISGILENINYNVFEVFCYSMKVVSIKDSFPNIQWKLVKGLSPESFCKVIKDDHIDILFDLSSQTGDNRLDTFVLKPAPIQISYCGYPNTSGIYSMDYHITDTICDSDGTTPGPDNVIRPSTQKYYVEKLLFAKKCFLSYTPALGVDNIPPLDIQPFTKNGYLTIGTFNRYNKINDNVVSLWERTLKECPNVRFVIKTKEFLTKSLKDQFEKTWKDQSVLKRVEILPYSDTYLEHLPDYNKIDIAVDTFPYSGTTTSCEALIMGVPIITMFDTQRQYHHQNVTSSLLYHSGLKDYIVTTNDMFVEKVKELSKGSLDNLKQDVRKKFLNNICNHKEFVKDFENLLLDTYSNHF